MRELIINGKHLMILCDHPQVLGDIVLVPRDGVELQVRIMSVAHFGESTKFQYNVEAMWTTRL